LLDIVGPQSLIKLVNPLASVVKVGERASRVEGLSILKLPLVWGHIIGRDIDKVNILDVRVLRVIIEW
jgi:hypothetical protein